MGFSGSVPVRHLPEEIWDLIIRQLEDDPKSMAAIRRVNKRLNRIVLPGVFLKRISFKNTEQGAYAMKHLIDSVECAGHVKELEFLIISKSWLTLNLLLDVGLNTFIPKVAGIWMHEYRRFCWSGKRFYSKSCWDIDAWIPEILPNSTDWLLLEPGQDDLDDSRRILSTKEVPPRIYALTKIFEHVLFGPNSERFFICLEKFSIRLPVVYHHSIENQNSLTLTQYEGINIFQLYRYTTCMYLQMFMRMISRFEMPDDSTQKIRISQESMYKPLRPTTVEFINLSSHNFALDHGNTNLPSVKHFQLRLCKGQVLLGNRELQTPSQIQTYWSSFKSKLSYTLRRCFYNLETVHIVGWWDQCRYRYLQNISDMTLDDRSLNGLPGQSSHITNITLENLVLYRPRFKYFAQAPPGATQIIKFKNCIFATGKRTPSDPPVFDGWVEFFDSWAATMGGTRIKLCVESADGVEGDPSAFMYAKYKRGEDVVSDSMVYPKLSTPWKEADVQYEDRAVEAYWELQRLMTSQESAQETANLGSWFGGLWDKEYTTRWTAGVFGWRF